MTDVDDGAGKARVARLSRHPADALIRELLRVGRQATPEQVARIVERLATAPFEPRQRTVRPAERGITYQGRVLGEREDSLFHHLIKRILVDEQWGYGTTASDYLADLRRAVRSPAARLALYRQRGGHVAATVTSTAEVVPPERQGPQALPNLLAIYSADRGIIVTGYQCSALDQTRIPETALWLG